MPSLRRQTVTRARKAWTRVAFGNVVRQVKEKVDPLEDGIERYVAGEHMQTDDVRIRSWGLVGDGYLGPAFHTRFRPGQVLYGSRRTYLRKVAVPDFEGVCANTTFVMEPKDPQALLPNLLPFLMQTEEFHKHAIEKSKGSVNPYVNFSDIATFEFDLPPLDEQQQLAAALATCDTAMVTLEDLDKCVRAVGSSLFERAFASTTRLAPLADLLSRDIQYGSSTRANSDGRGVPMLRIPNVLRGHLDSSDLKWVELPKAEINKYSVSEGDVLVVRTNGNPEYVARGTAIPQLAVRTVFASYLLRLTPDARKITSTYLAGAIATPRVRRHLAASIRSSAGNFNINAQDLGNVEIPWPEIQDQRALEDRLAPLADARGSIAARQTSHRRVKACLLRTLIGEVENA